MVNIIALLYVVLTSFAVAKRGDASDFRSVSFKGRPLEKETFVTRHEDIVLECEVGGSPSPTVHWLKDGTRIQQVPKFLLFALVCFFYIFFLFLF